MCRLFTVAAGSNAMAPRRALNNAAVVVGHVFLERNGGFAFSLHDHCEAGDEIVTFSPAQTGAFFEHILFLTRRCRRDERAVPR